ncbi:MAG: XdhC family protein [Alphaproteobacteria bacterium]|nr:XdhC family protein [Alphaproteobacteria bacterium]MCZ6592442.1 XdhC family protein [Alphaproteobacteria bacterium]MCZ6841089.1 XdhC family protein [Alphaproteobacteria bacterium]
MPKEPDDVIDCMARMKGEEQPFAVATVVHVQGGASAREGSKAVIRGDGSVVGWIGGGCTLGAVKKTSARALVDGRARFIRVRPKDGAIAEVSAENRTEDFDNFCATGGTIEIFIEPVLPRASLIVVGGTLVAQALADLGKRLGFAVTVAALQEDLDLFSNFDHSIEGFDPEQALRPATSFVVVASQGKRDRDALRFALATESGYVAFVASRKKAAKLRQDLRDAGSDPAAVSRIRSPAGANIGAVTPEEIALSILTDIVQERRLGTAEDDRKNASPSVLGGDGTSTARDDVAPSDDAVSD